MKAKVCSLLFICFLISCYQPSKLNTQQWQLTGIKQYEMDSLEAAIKTFTEIIKVNDTCLACYQYRAFAYKEIKEYDSALSDLNFYIKLDTSKAVGYANRASIYYLTNNYRKALSDFQKVLALNPKNTIMYNPISHMLFATGQKEKACEYYVMAMAKGDTSFNQEIIDYCKKK